MTDINRLAVITALAQRCDNLGRTALMKFCCFLQVLRGFLSGIDSRGTPTAPLIQTC